MISQEQIESVVQVIVEGYEPMKIILFGSYAYGHPTKDSDLDLLIIKDGEASGIQRNRRVRNILKDFSIPIDVIVKSSQEFDMLKDVIGTVIYPANKYGKVVYEQK
ncbi:MAG: nucleotidyltransferase domain-containing protein [ANME-2 cluster archaeon]|jgi:predicted nucleotidyltransferase|nr:MAG: putative nucleotidyltransferase [ANME-2 cluster archaeon]MRG77035.1 nucleotidyltransferase domain-containing protein [ANME-2 cluster archaeon]